MERNRAVKVVLYGNSGAGKSALATRYVLGSYDSNLPSTIGAAFYAKIINLNPKLTLNIWDTAGSERYNSLAPMYLRGAKIVLLCFEDPNIEDLDRKISKIKEINLIATIFLVATKMDLSSNLTHPLVDNYARSNDLKLFYTSSFHGTGISELFDEIYKIGKDSVTDEFDRPIKIERQEEPKKDKPCCGYV